MMQVPRGKAVRGALLGSTLVLGLLTGCKSDEEKALEQAKAQAASTNTPQQIQYVDNNGDTVTTTVQPPQPGQAQAVTTTTAPPPPGPKPSHTKPVITPVNQVPTPAAPNAMTAMTAMTPGPAGPDAPPPSGPNGAAPDNNEGVYPAVAPETAPAPNANPAPAVNVSIPAGTELAIRINQRINVKYVHAGSAFTGEVADGISRGGQLVVPRGTPVRGVIDEAHRRGHFKGASVLELRLTSMTLNGNRYEIDTHDAVRTKKGKGKRTAGFIGGMTGAGMLIGGIASGGVGLGIGAAAGAGTGTLLAGVTGNRDIVIPAESIVHFRLADQLVVQNP